MKRNELKTGMVLEFTKDDATKVGMVMLDVLMRDQNSKDRTKKVRGNIIKYKDGFNVLEDVLDENLNPVGKKDRKLSKIYEPICWGRKMDYILEGLDLSDSLIWDADKVEEIDWKNLKEGTPVIATIMGEKVEAMFMEYDEEHDKVVVCPVVMFMLAMTVESNHVMAIGLDKELVELDK